MFKISPKTLVLGGLAIAAAAGALKNRDRVAGLIGARSSAPEPPRPEPAQPEPPRHGAPETTAPSNYDLDGPAANTATAVPAPDVTVRDDDGGIDERAEEQAAAAEAAAIGGATPDYPGTSLDEEPDDATRPLVEAGEGESEGEEVAEFDLRDEAEPSSGATSDAERQIDETIEAQDKPMVGETIEAVEASAPDSRDEDDKLAVSTADDSDDAFRSAATDDERAARAASDETADGVNRVAAEPPRQDFDFAGGKVGAEPDAPVAEDDPAPGLPNEAAAAAAEDAAGDDDEGPTVHPDQTSLLEDAESPKETPAAEKSSAVWEPPKPASEDDEDDDGGSEWQTWSGRAVK